MVEYPVPHSEVEQARHNPAFVKPHYRGLRGYSSSVTDNCTGIDLHQGRETRLGQVVGWLSKSGSAYGRHLEISNLLAVVRRADFYNPSLMAEKVRVWGDIFPNVLLSLDPRDVKAKGIRYTIVNGGITFEESECTHATPGKFLRSYDMVNK